MAWISVHEPVPDHPKTRRLAKSLHVSRHEAVGILVMLWLWGVDNANQDGSLLSADASDIADGIFWRGDPGALLSALVESGWINETADGMQLHDWDIHQQ